MKKASKKWKPAEQVQSACFLLSRIFLGEDQKGNIGHGNGKDGEENNQERIDFEEAVENEKDAESGNGPQCFLAGGLGDGIDLEKASQKSDEEDIAQDQDDGLGEAEIAGDDSRKEPFGREREREKEQEQKKRVMQKLEEDEADSVFGQFTE
jgi:hypothetical protein